MGTHPIFESDFDCLTDMLHRFGLVKQIHRFKRESLFSAIGQDGRWFTDHVEERWAKMSGPFVKVGDNLKTVPFVRDKVYIPVGKYGKKLEAERLYERIYISDQEALRLGALIMANFVAFYFWWTVIWWIHGFVYSVILSMGVSNEGTNDGDYETEIRSLEAELIKSRRELGALNLELSKLTRDIVSLRRQNETLDELAQTQRVQISKLKEQLIL